MEMSTPYTDHLDDLHMRHARGEISYHDMMVGSGFVGGVTVGAELGSMVLPVVGTIIGGVIGGVLGYIAGDKVGNDPNARK